MGTLTHNITMNSVTLITT